MNFERLMLRAIGFAAVACGCVVLSCIACAAIKLVLLI